MKEEIKEKIDGVVEDVMEENYYEEYSDEAVGSIVREFNSQIQLGIFRRLDGKEVEKVLAGKTEMGWILQFYTKVHSEEGDTRGEGFAYNLEAPDLSEWGSLYTPSC